MIRRTDTTGASKGVCRVGQGLLGIQSYRGTIRKVSKSGLLNVEAATILAEQELVLY
jgi:hypothetical protein